MEAGHKERFDDSCGGEDPPLLDIRRAARFPFSSRSHQTLTKSVSGMGITQWSLTLPDANLRELAELRGTVSLRDLRPSVVASASSQRRAWESSVASIYALTYSCGHRACAGHEPSHSANQAGSCRYPGLGHNETQERFNGIGTDSHMLCDLFAGQTSYQQSHSLSLTLGQAQSITEFLDGNFGRAGSLHENDHRSCGLQPLHIEDVSRATVISLSGGQLSHSIVAIERRVLFEEDSHLLSQEGPKTRHTCWRSRISQNLNGFLVTNNLIETRSNQNQSGRRQDRILLLWRKRILFLRRCSFV